MRADFLRFYGIEAEDVPVSEMWDMLLSLPRGARSLTLIDPRTAWSEGEYILADIYDLLGAAFCGMGGAPAPDPYPRPGDVRGPSMTPQEVRELIENTEWMEVARARS